METSLQKSVNRMARTPPGVLPSPPVAFSQAEGGSMPATARLEKRQGAFATRLASVLSGPHHGISSRIGLGARLRNALSPGTNVREVEKIRVSQGQTFPGEICLPPTGRGRGEEKKEKEKEEKIKKAVSEAQGYSRCPSTVYHR